MTYSKFQAKFFEINPLPYKTKTIHEILVIVMMTMITIVIIGIIVIMTTQQKTVQ